MKHEVLSRYLDVYVSKVGSTESQLYYVDGFAGCGVYDDGQIGSPLIAAMKSSKPITHSSTGKLRCIFVEEDAQNAATLDAALKADFPSVQASIVEGRFDLALSDILKTVTSAPTFFFIDPFGFQSVNLDLLKAIRSSTNAKSEVLLRFDDIYLKRMGAFAAKHSTNATEASVQKAAKTFAAKCSAVLGKDWSPTSDASHDDIAASYCDLIKAEGLFKFAISYPVTNPETKGHHYFLVHLSNFEDGYIFMADFMGQIERSIDHKDAGVFPQFNDGPTLGVIIDGAVKAQDKMVEKENIQMILKFYRAQPRSRWNQFSPLKRRHFCAAAVDEYAYRIRLKEAQKALTAWLNEIGGRADGTKESSKVYLPWPPR